MEVCQVLIILSINTDILRRHLKRDIEPFVCIAESCTGQVRFFDNFKLWLKHIQQEHRLQWHCTMATHRPIVFSDREKFETHMLTEHKGKLNQSQLATLIQRGAQPASHAFDECPLCKAQLDVNSEEHFAKDVVISDRLPRHVAGHLKTLALMFLPPGDNSEEDGTDEPGSSSTKKSSRSVDADSIFEFSLTFDDGASSREDHDDTEWIFLPRENYDRDQDAALKRFASNQFPRPLGFETVVHFVDFCKRLISNDKAPGRLAEAIAIDGKPVRDNEHAENVSKQIQVFDEELQILKSQDIESSHPFKENQFLSNVASEYIYLSTKVLACTKAYEGDMSYPPWTWESLREGLKTSLGGEHDMIQFEARLMNLRDMILAHYSSPPL
jgi:hypothetical protein